MKTAREILEEQMEIKIASLNHGENPSKEYIQEQEKTWRPILSTMNTAPHVLEAMKAYAEQFIDSFEKEVHGIWDYREDGRPLYFTNAEIVSENLKELL